MPDDPKHDWQRSGYHQFEIGDVLTRGLAGLRDRLKDVALISLLLIGGPGVIVNASSYITETSNVGGPLLVIVGVIVFIVGAILLPAVLVQIFVRGFWGEHLELDVALRDGMARFWPMLGAGIIAGIGMICGFVLLIVPAFILYCGWYIFLPIVVGEKRDPVESLTRSWELTRGYKWQIFAIILIGTVIAALAGAVMGGIGGGVLGLEAVNMDVSADPIKIFLFASMQSLAGVIGTAVSTAFVSSTYVELLKLKGEYDPDSGAPTFG